MHHIIKDLRWAEHCKRPPNLPNPRLRGTKALGLSYERKVASQFPASIRGQWWKFEDQDGIGYCQTDIVLLLFGHLIILECKLTDCERGRLQLSQLYIPVVRTALCREAHGIVVARNASRESGIVTSTLAEALRLAKDGVVPTLQWLGKSAFPL